MCRASPGSGRSTGFLDKDGARAKSPPLNSPAGRLPIDPELIIRTLVNGYVIGIRSERHLCEAGRLDSAYRWFCSRLGAGKRPAHLTFSRYRHCKLGKSDLLRPVVQDTVERCLKADWPQESVLPSMPA